ncbi:MAG: histidine--tRNA ligase [Candidatus Nanohaloarchaea archaeon]|nr:histidine--tRNA ligase [Candidatus Nanohaloarchaea archaeon]
MTDDMTEFQRLKGFRDFLPDEMAARREVFDRIEAVGQRYGFREIDTPSLESTDLYRVKSGEELLEQTFSFEDQGGREVTLLPEMTPTRARLVAERRDLSLPVKWYDQTKRWRYEAPQKGRLREFYQMDMDIFGTDLVQADAEILAVAVDIFDALEVLDAVTVLLNDRRVLDAVLESHGIGARDAVLDIIDDKEKMDQDEFRAELQEAGLSVDEAANVDELTAVSGPITEVIDEVDELVPDDDTAQDAVDRMRELIAALEQYEVTDSIEWDLSIVRGLDYYTGLVFEVFDTDGELRALCGGGRYDELVQQFGGEPTPAVGFAPGDAPIEQLMKREGVWPAEEVTTDVYVLAVSDKVREEALSIARELRADGNVVETDLMGRSVSAQFDYADSINAETVVVVGERDLEQGQVTVKDMETGAEEAVDRDSI